MNRLSLTSTLTFRTTVVQNKYFLSVLSDCSKKKATCHLHFSVRTPRCPFFVKVEENSPSIPGNLFTISSHAQRADSGLCDCDCFSISEDYLRVCTQYRPGHEEKKSTRGSGKQVGCVEGKGTLCFSRIQESDTNSNICTISCNLVQPSVRLWRWINSSLAQTQQETEQYEPHRDSVCCRSVVSALVCSSDWKKHSEALSKITPCSLPSAFENINISICLHCTRI